LWGFYAADHPERTDGALILILAHLLDNYSALPLGRNINFLGSYLYGFLIGGLNGAEMFGALADDIDAASRAFTTSQIRTARSSPSLSQKR
jgi:hypothetical protein